MAMVPGARRRRLGEDEEEELVDRISLLPDGILGDIVSLLPTKEGGRTQVLSSRWRHVWHAAPLNFDLPGRPVADVSRILAAHPGPCRRFCINMDRVRYEDYGASKANLDSCLRSPSLNNLQELELLLGDMLDDPLPPLPAPVCHFSPTLRVASFQRCSFPNTALHLPLLQQLSLVHVRISETSLHALLAGCSVLESLLLRNNNGFPHLQIVSSSLRSIGVWSHRGDDRLRQLIIEDAPCLERLLIFNASEMDMSVISAPRLTILGELGSVFHRLQFGTTTIQGPSTATLTTMMRSVKVLALSYVTLSLDAVINLIKCFSCLENLYIQIQTNGLGENNTWCRKYRNLIGTFDIRLNKIVASYYRGNKSHVNFAKFFISNATMLESMCFELEDRNMTNEWIERQHRLLQIENRASRDAQFYFESRNKPIPPFCYLHAMQEQVHDLSTADPFERIYN